MSQRFGKPQKIFDSTPKTIRSDKSKDPFDPIFYNGRQGKTGKILESENQSKGAGIYSIDYLVHAQKLGCPTPYYVLNYSDEEVYVKTEEGADAIPIPSKYAYIYRVDGVHSKPVGVYKVPDFGAVEITADGHVVPIGIVSGLCELIIRNESIHKAINKIKEVDMGYKDRKWLDDLHKKNPLDHGWDALFDVKWE